MKFKLNPLTGEFDYTSDSANKEKLNPMTGEFNLVEGDWPFSQIFNPLTGNFNLASGWGHSITGHWIIDIVNSQMLTKVIAYWKCWWESWLPVTGYTQLEYVSNTFSGSQSTIDTGITDDTVDMQYMVEATGVSAWASWYILQSRNTAAAGWNTSIYGISWSQNWGTILWAPWTVWTGLRSNITRDSSDDFFHVGFTRTTNSQTLYVKNLTSSDDDIVTGSQDLSWYVAASTTIGIFWNWTNFILAWAKVKRAGIRKNWYLVWGMIPCKRNSDWACWYYEVVSWTFTALDVLNFWFGNEIVQSPTNPIPFYCNNGKILAYKSTICDCTIDGNGTFVQPTTPTVGPRIYKSLWHLPVWKYFISTTWNFEIIFQYKDVESWTPTRSGNMTWWTINATVTITDPDLYYGVAIRYPNNNNIDVSDYTGTLTCAPQFMLCDWVTEKIISHDDNNDYAAYTEWLLSIDNIEDEQEIISWSIKRNVGIKVLDGTEAWNMYNVAQWVLFRIALQDVKQTWARLDSAWCSHFITSTVWDRTNWTLSWVNKNFDFIYSQCTDLASWKAWLWSQFLAWTPVVIIYKIKTPTTETVDWQTLDVVWDWYVAIEEAGIETWMLKLAVEYR